jgi:hypothetical protein
VAVCICGQRARLDVTQLVRFLHVNNHLTFDVFMHLSDGDGFFQWDTDTGRSRGVARHTPSAVIEDAFTAVSRSYSLSLWPLLDRDRLIHEHRLVKLDRITQYVKIQVRIMNMYHHQLMCGREVDRSATKYEAVIYLREDVFFFHDTNVSVPMRALGKHCDLVAKDCLGWGGINMRLQLLTDTSFLVRRFDFYRHLIATGNTVFNPEQFELRQANWMAFVSVVPAFRTCQWSSLG